MKFLIFLIFLVLFTGITINVNAESVDDMHNTALHYMNTQDFTHAINEYSRILEVAPDNKTALLNRAFAFAMIDEHEAGINDLNKVLENEPRNMLAIKGKASILSEFKCESYDNCRPNEALELLDMALESNPDDEDLEMKRDFLLSKAETFDVRDTNGDYIVNIQLITRDQNGMLVSVIENSGTSILPSRILEKHLDGKENLEYTTVFKKEVVVIDGQGYIKWHIEKKFDTENERFWRGTVSFEERVEAKSDERQNVLFFKEILRAIIPAQGFDKGYETLLITEIFKKI